MLLANDAEMVADGGPDCDPVRDVRNLSHPLIGRDNRQCPSR